MTRHFLMFQVYEPGDFIGGLESLEGGEDSLFFLNVVMDASVNGVRWTTAKLRKTAERLGLDDFEFIYKLLKPSTTQPENWVVPEELLGLTQVVRAKLECAKK